MISLNQAYSSINGTSKHQEYFNGTCQWKSLYYLQNNKVLFNVPVYPLLLYLNSWQSDMIMDTE